MIKIASIVEWCREGSTCDLDEFMILVVFLQLLELFCWKTVDADVEVLALGAVLEAPVDLLKVWSMGFGLFAYLAYDWQFELFPWLA